ncbi:MerR family transcriptional regulator [Proteus mirabilis]|nr:MerR family transcriptional regulator [Proteus mirabilis]HEJ9412133.1 MerR family transcriptional regulator [Proteus mirabilis]
MPLKKFCAITGINIRTARYWIHKGDLKIKPKNKPKERVYVDWQSYDKEWLM